MVSADLMCAEAGGLMTDVAHRGLSAFFSLLSQRHARATTAAEVQEPTATMQADSILQQQKQAALVLLAADMSAASSQEAAAVTAPRGVNASKRLTGFLRLVWTAAKRVLTYPGRLLRFMAPVKNLAVGSVNAGVYR